MKKAICRKCAHVIKDNYYKGVYRCSCLPSYDNVIPSYLLTTVHCCDNFLLSKDNQIYLCSECYYYRNRRCHNIENALLIDDDIILGGSLEGEGIHTKDFDISPNRNCCTKFKYLEEV